MTAVAANENTVKLACHPTRLRILALMRDREVSPTEMAEQLGASLGSVSYHVRALADAGLLAQTRTRMVRGAIEHFYVLAPERDTGLEAAISELIEIAKRARKAVRR